MSFRIFLALLSLVIVGCSSASRKAADQPVAKPPVEVEIPQSFTREGKLHVRASLRPLVNLRSDEILVGIVGLDNGTTKREEFRSLLELSQRELVNGGETFISDFEIPAEGLTEYQIIVKWGEEARLARGSLGAPTETKPPETKKVQQDSPPELLPEDSPPIREVVLKDLALRRVSQEGCDKPPCDEVCSFQGDLVNGLERGIDEISLALGVTFVPKGAALTHPKDLEPLKADEQEVALSGVVLPAGGRKELEVKLSEPLAEIPEGSFVPYLRVLKYR